MKLTATELEQWWNRCTTKDELDRKVKIYAATMIILHSLPTVQAQAFFWNYSSTRDRIKAIHAAMREEKGGDA